MNEDLITFIEPELEARIVALVLGEASAFEREELERIIAERPEARLFKNRMEALHGLVDEASNPVDAIAWKLSSERRKTVLSKIRQEQPVVAALPAKKPANQFHRRLVFYGAAACFVAVVAGLATPTVWNSVKSDSSAPVIVSYSAEADDFDLRETVRFAGTETREKARAGDLLATIDGDYSMEVPTVKSERELDVKLASNFTLASQPEKRKAARKGVSFSSKREANTRDGGLKESLYASIEDQVGSGNEERKERLQRMAEAVEIPAPGKPAGTFFRSEVDRPLEPASEPVPANAPVVRGLAEKAKEIDPTGFTGVAGNTESLAALPDLAAAPTEGQPPVDVSDFGFAGQAVVGAEMESLGLARESVEKKPAAPSSSLSKVIAASTVRPAAVPVPQPEIDAEFANGNDFGEGWYADQPTSGSDFLGGGVVGRDFRRDHTGAANSVDRVKIPGIPDSPEQAVAGIVTGGNRSGSAAVGRNNVDAILNNFEEPSAGSPGFPVTPATPAAKGRGAGGLVGSDKESLVEYDPPELPASGGMGREPSSQRNRGERDKRIAQDHQGDADPFGGGGGGSGGGDADPFATSIDEVLVKRESVRHQAADPESEERSSRSIVVQTTFVDVKQENVEELGFDWAETPPGETKSEGRGGEKSVAGRFGSDAKGLERLSEEQDLDLDGITLSEEDSAKLQKLGDEVQEKRKELTVQIQQQGVPYFDGRGSSPVGATEEEMYRHAQRSLDDFESDRELLAQELQKVREEKTQNSDQIEDVLKSKLSLLDRQVDKMREVVDNKQDVTVELSLRQNHYNQSKEEYEMARDELRSLKIKLAAKGAPARDALSKNRALLAEIDAAIPSDDKWSSPADVAIVDDGVSLDDVELKSKMTRGLSVAEIKSIPLYDSATTWDEKSQATAKKLNEIVLPELDLSNVTVEEAMAIIKEKAKEADLGEVDEFARGVDLHVRTPRVVDEDGLDDSGLGGAGDPNQILIKKLNLKNVPLRVALQYVADEAKLRYKVDNAGVTLLPSGADDTADIVQRRFVVPEGFEAFLSAGISEGEDDPFGRGDDSDAGGIKPRMGIVDIFKNNGVSFPPNASVSFLKDSNTLIVRNSPTNLGLIDMIVKASQDEALKTEEVKKQKQTELDSFETSTSQKSDSTFSLNVSDVSFKLAKSSLANGQWPEADKVRPEEFVNALSYGDDTPTQDEKVACVIEQGSHPFMQQRNLMRVSMSTAALGRNASTPLRLTVLLDQSGSMERADRAESVRRAFALLTSQLNANDEITLIGFARTPRLLAERVKGNESGKLAQIVANPLTEGGTNLEAALSSGLQLARQQFVEGAQNRIILLTDGAANLGNALPEDLAKHISKMRDAGIAFDACGVGADGLNDEVLTSLAKQGDGRYYFLDRPKDADEGFARQIAGALRPAAKNVKVQVIFNPERVSKFKLYGFEKHQLKKEDFRNDSVDAAEMAAEESGVALYHFQPLPEGRGDIGTVSVRFLDTATNQMVERTWTIPYQSDSTTFSEANPTLRLASVAGLFAERLKGSSVGERVELKRLRQETELLKPIFRNQARFQEFQTMLQQAGE